jgi:isomaltose glucohydrolase
MENLRDVSIELILKNQSETGGYIASPNFRVYQYSWYRDGAFISHAMSIVGQFESALKFHEWAATNINKRSGQIKDLINKRALGQEIFPDEHLHCRYTVDNNESQEDWTNYQLDGFGIWIWSLDEFIKNTGFKSQNQIAAVQNLIPYLATFWTDGQFDWWEESFGYQHISTIAAISVGLERCSHWPEISPELRSLAKETSVKIEEYVLKFGVQDGHLIKWIGNNNVDGSLAALVAPLNFLKHDSTLAKRTLDEISTKLGLLGTHRHLSDVYFGGGQWLILSSFLALGYIAIGERDLGEKVLTWIESQANENSELPEQVTQNLLFPEMRGEWIKKWGEPALPLLWSHAMYLILQGELEKVLN